MEQKEQITNHALQKFLTGEITNTTMDEFAKELKISKKTIYKFFPSKEDLIDAAIKIFMGKLKTEIASIVTSSQNAVEKIFSIKEYIKKAAQKMGYKPIAYFLHHNNVMWEKIAEFRRQLINENFTKITEQGKQEGLIENLPTDIMINVYIASIQSTINPEFLFSHSYSISEAVDYVFQILLNGILTPEGKEIYKNINEQAAK